MQEHLSPYRQPEQSEKEDRKSRRLWLIRNVLNLLFIIMAIITMVCIGMHFGEDETPMWCYLLGIIAVIIKMCESLLRMPGLRRNSGNPYRTHRRRR